MRGQAWESPRSGTESLLSTLWTWASYFTLLSLHFLSYKRNVVSRQPPSGSASSFEPRSWSSCSSPQPSTEQDGSQCHILLDQWMSKAEVQRPGHFCPTWDSLKGNRCSGASCWSGRDCQAALWPDDSVGLISFASFSIRRLLCLNQT